MARRSSSTGGNADPDVVDVDAKDVTADDAAPELAAWSAWPAVFAQASEAWWRLQAEAWQQQIAWWNGLAQGRMPLLQAFDIAEAEAEHAANPLAASPLWLPAQEAGRHAATLAAANWNNWLGFTGGLSRWFEGPRAR